MLRRKTSDRLCRERGVHQSMKVFVSHVLTRGITIMLMDACTSLAARRISRSVFLQILPRRMLNRFDEILERGTVIPPSFLSSHLPLPRFYIISLKGTNMWIIVVDFIAMMIFNQLYLRPIRGESTS